MTDLVALRAYLDANPSTYGALSDQEVAVALETPSIVRVRASMTGSEIMDSTDPTEFGTKTDSQKSQWLALCAVQNVDPGDGKLARDLAVSIFGGVSTTVTTLAAARLETVSPSVDEGLGIVTTFDVTQARAI